MGLLLFAAAGAESGAIGCAPRIRTIRKGLRPAVWSGKYSGKKGSRTIPACRVGGGVGVSRS